MTQHVQEQTYGYPGLDGAGAAARLRGLGFEGAVHLPGEDPYEERRQPLFDTIDPYPAIVAEPSGPADVRAAVLTAREHDLPLAVQATGHGTHVPADGGVLLRTDGLSSVVVDPAERVARVGPGALWGDVIAAAAPFGLAPLAGSSPDVGVVGYTLGGGLGWLGRAYGFAADSVVRAEVVTADGGFVAASPDSHASLFWALRGGGANFGVVTRLEFRLYPAAQVHAGFAYYPIERAADVLTRYREWIADAPDALSTAVVLRRVPDTDLFPEAVRGRRVVVLKAMYAGASEDAEQHLRPLREAAGPALVDDIRPTTFAAAAMGGQPARFLDLYHGLPDPVLHALANAVEEDPDSPVSAVEIRHWGGAMADPGPGAGPVGHRSVPLSVIIDADVPELTATLRPYGTGGSFLNFLDDPGNVPAAYTTADYRRLAEVKREYDPANLFRLNHNIAPALPVRAG
ncbi:oxidoreductase [Sphaerisporangium krabiense]|uniref:FAD/FMN-containing dehydrogenase n=1 Tax=Sphaerisporangium krabiense TaxID=763782 RepID=A0A7W8ZB20_9ACTN|nr:FAD-binding oxidoreductase [Sphaerisporangium krabiense]MBB5630723.1 FAD/FMN-containing dehydrogenase [Sphaerisporangium krabiense]GII67411.1 oxidoreductase [Sphaerisporangium krabiense]